MKKTRKGIFMALGLAAVLALSACTVEVENDVAEEKEEQKQAESIEVYNKSGITITYIGNVYEEDEFFGDSMKFNFDVKNDTDKTLEVQAREVSTDGRMVDESLLSMSDEISAGKVGTATLTFSELGDVKLPENPKELELTLHVFDWESDFAVDVPVKLAIK